MEDDEDSRPSPRPTRTVNNRQRLVQILGEALAIANEDLTARLTASNNNVAEGLPVEMTAVHSSNESAGDDVTTEPNEASQSSSSCYPDASKDRCTEP
jgi:hypothetical protein